MSKELKGIFIRKIVITALFLCIPLLLFPASLFNSLGIPLTVPTMFLRLLGVAYLALIVGYYYGIKALERQQNPLFAIDMGIASNGAAFVVIIYFGITGAWTKWSLAAELYMWALSFGALLITGKLFRARPAYAKANQAR